MMNVHSLVNCNRLTYERVLIDTNVWIYVEWNNDPTDYRAIMYSRALADLRTAGVELVTNDYVIGEFVNRCARIQFEAEKKSNPNLVTFKDFRQDSSFCSTADEIYSICCDIIGDCEYRPVNISKNQLESCLEKSCRGEMDLADLVTSAFCSDQGLPILTHDADYRFANLDLITGNRRLLKTGRTGHS